MPVLTRSMKRKVEEEKQKGFPLFRLPLEIMERILGDLSWKDRMEFKITSKRSRSTIESRKSLQRIEIIGMVITSEKSTVSWINGQSKWTDDFLSKAKIYTERNPNQVTHKIVNLNDKWMELMRDGCVQIRILDFHHFQGFTSADQEFISLANPRVLSVLTGKDERNPLKIPSNCEDLCICFGPFDKITLDLDEAKRLKKLNTLAGKFAFHPKSRGVFTTKIFNKLKELWSPFSELKNSEPISPTVRAELLQVDIMILNPHQWDRHRILYLADELDLFQN